MKKYLPGFLAGVCTTILLGSFGLTALAASGAMTITVDPIDIQVNGETFVPTDVNGVEVPVFAYNGTTYAPLRALAEAYGLEVGYDAESNMATVTDLDAPVQPPATDAFTTADYSNWTEEDKAAYQEFKDMWEVRLQDSENVNLDYKLDTPFEKLKTFAQNNEKDAVEMYCRRLGTELYQQYERTKFIYGYDHNSGVLIWWLWIDRLVGNEWDCGYSKTGYDRIMQR